ncbi:MAG: DNA repair protein RecN [Bacteroidales bacterium]|nr:DNA repair protein RecN [Bacteroidales bacterium]
MLKSLYIDNYALIDNLFIDFHKGLSIITGETGAGKSILLGALSLILGRRADTSVLNDRSKKCIVEAIFNIDEYDLQHFFEKNDIDYDESTVLRREIGSNGKSRAFINDTPVTLDTINELTRKLIDIHSQHENLSLNDSVFQLKVIDSYGNLHGILEDYRSAYLSYRDLLREYHVLKENYEKNKADLDYFQFQYNQLAEARLQAGEQEDLELEQEQLAHAEEIKTGLEEALTILSDDASGLISRLKSLQNIISRLLKYLPQTGELSGRIESAYIDLKDIGSELDNLYHHTTLDPERLDFVNSRLDLIFTLQKKHGVQTVSELIEIQANLKKKTDDILNADFRLDELSSRLSKHEETMKKKSELLTAARKKMIPEIQRRVIQLLVDLGIPNAKFSIQHKPLEIPFVNGNDEIQFMFTANKNAPLQEVSRIASGGELSRFMLAIKSLISDSVGLPTIIFDEIDTGVAGEIAYKVGTIIKKMSEGMQVINITHLPQVASKGDYHYLVYKLDHESSTKTYMKLLSHEERHLEIAKMLSGKELTDAAMENARELLKN